MSDPGYTEKDLYYYGPLMAGIVIAYLALGRLGVTSQIIRLLAGLALGVALGWYVERAYVRSRKKADGEGQDKT